MPLYVPSGTPTIADNSITYAKIQQTSATDKILGRFSTGAGNVEEIACTSAGRALLDDADAAAQRTTLGLDEAWKGVIVGCDGDGNPNNLLSRMNMHTIEMTPTLLTISLARVSYFRLDTAITFNKVRVFGIGATTNIFQLALYNADTLARIWTSGTFTTSAQAWLAIGNNINITLSAGQGYFIAVSANTTGTTAGMKCFGATTGRMGVVPKSWPGSLDFDSSIVKPYAMEAQFAVTTGALPDPAATIAARGTMACGFPAVFLDSSNA